MSDEQKQANKARMAHYYIGQYRSRAESSFAAPVGSVSAEQWWTHHAELLAAKMKVGGVKSFRIELNVRGNYEFEVVPTTTPND